MWLLEGLRTQKVSLRAHMSEEEEEDADTGVYSVEEVLDMRKRGVRSLRVWLRSRSPGSAGVLCQVVGLSKFGEHMGA